MKQIQLSKGKVALVDDADYEWLAQSKWHAMKAARRNVKSEVWYAQSCPARGVHVYMHRAIASRIGLRMDRGYDHKDGNGLNNQRSNLRPCTQSQNNQNAQKRIGSTSRFKGVSWVGRVKKWAVHLRFNNKKRWIGYFFDEVVAAKAYDSEAKKCFGEFARINFP